MADRTRKKAARSGDRSLVATHRLNAKRLEVLRQFRVVFKSVRRHYQQVERRSEISGALLWALAHIAENPEVTVGNVARALAIHPSTASNLIRRLASLALIARKRRGKDQRNVQLYASTKGLAALRRAPKPLIGVLQQALADLPAYRIEALHSELDKLIALMKVKDVGARALLISEM